MEELRKLVFEKIKFDKLKISKGDYLALVEKGQELGIEEPKVKKLVSSCLKSLKTFKGKTLPLSILEEKNVALEAEELYVSADTLEAWRLEAEEKLKELEKILALNNQESLRSFIEQNPEMESVSKVPLSKFVKSLHKNSEPQRQEPEPESEKIESNASLTNVVPEGNAENARKTGGAGKKENKPPVKKGLPLSLIIGSGIMALLVVVILFLVTGLPSDAKIEDFLNVDYQYGKIVDTRDNFQYYTVEIAGQTWLAQNVNYRTPSSICDSCSIYGRLYNYEEAASACPDGWDLPSFADVEAALKTKSVSSLFSAKFGGSNSSGFSAMAGGFFSYKNEAIRRKGEMFGFWLRDESSEYALRVKLEPSESGPDVAALNKSFGFSVRCIKAETSVYDENKKLLIDNRDAKFYKTMSVGMTQWMAENLNYKVKESFCYNDDSTNCNNYGRLYSFDVAQSICPEGWGLPDSIDVNALTYLPEGWGLGQKSFEEDASQLNLAYGGFRTAAGKYELMGTRADFWMSGEQNDKKGLYYWFSTSAFAHVNSFMKTAAMSVRCVELSSKSLSRAPNVEEAVVETPEQEELQEHTEDEHLEPGEDDEDRLEQERLEQERLEQERLEQERLEQERLEQERKEQERLEQERLEQERLEQVRKGYERLNAASKEYEDRRNLENTAARESEEESESPSADATVIGDVKVAAESSIKIDYDGYDVIFNEGEVNKFLKSHKAQIQSVYQSSLNSRSPFETKIKFRLTVRLSDGKILNVEDISNESNLSESGHKILFKQVAVEMKMWRMLPQHMDGEAYVEFPLKFVIR